MFVGILNAEPPNTICEVHNRPKSSLETETSLHYLCVCVDRWCIVSHLSQLNCHLISMSSHSLYQKQEIKKKNCHIFLRNYAIYCLEKMDTVAFYTK